MLVICVHLISTYILLGFSFVILCSRRIVHVKCYMTPSMSIYSHKAFLWCDCKFLVNWIEKSLHFMSEYFLLHFYCVSKIQLLSTWLNQMPHKIINKRWENRVSLRSVLQKLTFNVIMCVSCMISSFKLSFMITYTWSIHDTLAYFCGWLNT